MSDFVELFTFFAAERPDVRKMATAGIAQLSKDNKDLFAFISNPANKDHVAKFCDLIDPRLPPTAVPTLGDVLLTLVNISVDSACCDALISRSVPMKLLKLYETLAVKSDDVSNGVVLGELALMALNNLTSTSPTACEQMLELADEDLAGYHFGRLKTHYDRCPDEDDDDGGETEDVENANTNNNTNDTESNGAAAAASGDDETKKKEEESKQKKPTTTSHKKWIIQIALNACRIRDGSRLFLDDDDWRALPAELAAHPKIGMRALAMQLIRNLANFREHHKQLVDGARVLPPILHALCRDEDDATMLHGWIDVLTGLITSEDGMRGMDQVNAKRLFDGVVKQAADAAASTTTTTTTALVPAAAASSSQLMPSQRKVPVPRDIAKRIIEEILPFLDDVQDVYVDYGGGGGGDDDE